MINQLKHSFFQVFTVTSLWVTLLVTVFNGDELISMQYLWRVAGIAVIAAAVFGVMYDALWNHFTFRPVWNILISSILSLTGCTAAVWLYSTEMFEFILPWWPGMLLLTVVLHTISFYFYAKADSRKKAEELNRTIK